MTASHCRKDSANKMREAITLGQEMITLEKQKTKPTNSEMAMRYRSTSAQRPVIESWVHKGGEWPWRIEQIVHRDSSENLLGIWVLEVKDPHAVYWEKQDRPGRRIPATVPQAQWPFPRQGKGENGVNGSGVKERDELMEWLRR
ncbi:hypothetical protein F4801DRAFT_583809 [Xylaria longipes]|nr:hypothetical protein F4801DRAFT_583809 [Xylaria longipes]